MTTLVLHSGKSELGIDPATGRLASLRHDGRVFVRQPTGEGMIRLHAPLADFEAHMVSSHRTLPVCTGDAHQIVIEYPNLVGKRGPTGIAARVVIQAVDDAFTLRCSIRNGSAADVPQVFFPYFGGVLPVDGPEDAMIFGKTQCRPWREWVARSADHRMGFMDYSGHPERIIGTNFSYTTGMKWFDFGGDSAGVTLYSEEKTATAQFMYVSAESFFQTPETLDLGWFFYPFIRPGETWESAAFVLYPHAGNWRRGILKYKQHADRTFVPPRSTPARDATIGQQSLWISWHYQDWQDLRYTFRDIPALAAEARAAGITEMTVARATELDFCLPHKIRKPLGTAAEFKAAVAAARALGVNIIPFITCLLIREDTIGEHRHPQEWYGVNVAGQRNGDNWTYDPHMTPRIPIQQIGSRAAYYVCAGSQNWRKAFYELIEQVSEEWGCRGFMFDQSTECYPLCFNPLHHHKPAERTQLLSEALREARRRFTEKFGADGMLSGEAQWDAATEWSDLTWDWICFGDKEEMAPFHMAFPRARQCMKCTDDIPQINRIFTAGYLLDVNLEDGQGRLGDYPELTRYLASLAAFKRRFSRFFNQRDQYLYTLGTSHPADIPLWVRSHRAGAETLVMATHPAGAAVATEVTLDLRELIGRDRAKLTVWSRTLQQLSTQTASSPAKLSLSIPANDWLAVHVEPAD